MRSKVILMVILLLFSSYSLKLFVQANPESATKQPCVLQDNPVGKFQLCAGKVVVILGNRETCREDHYFLIAALNCQKVNLMNFDYTVVVNKIVTGFVQKADPKQPLVAYRYEIDATTNDPAYHDFLNRLKSRSYLTRLLYNTETPVTCHYLVVKDKLVLLSYYGLPAYYQRFRPVNLIAAIAR